MKVSDWLLVPGLLGLLRPCCWRGEDECAQRVRLPGGGRALASGAGLG